ncbi:hypothetical protein J7426_10050 [Tropicibacter sp. R16_0]|uniref:hypothetical protein n=1 Tax=Tropicibacter sp. R16_0 TaxID=2821102 RepID=UPI001ADC6B2B|nr:hypothetical protein [Tropicibacter sp. R16_0]MBO9450600.1 hypothetical protein [Tropicibacter sp. R16_0]
MKRLSTLSFIGAMLIAGAASACPWASGDYAFSEAGIYGDFTVNADCTEMVWDRSSDGPETAALERTKHGWKGELEKADVELLENGENLRVTGNGGAMRQVRAERKN